MRNQLLRFLLIGILMLISAYQFGSVLIHALIQPYQWAIMLLDSRFQDLSLHIVKLHGEQFLQLDVRIVKAFFIGTEYFVPNSPVVNSAVMPLGNILQPVILFLTLILAWPVTVIRQYFFRLLLGAPLILLVMMLDMPMQLDYMVWEGIQKSLNCSEQGLLLYWSDFLNGGGLIALSLACGVIAVSLAGKFFFRTEADR